MWDMCACENAMAIFAADLNSVVEIVVWLSSQISFILCYYGVAAMVPFEAPVFQAALIIISWILHSLTTLYSLPTTWTEKAELNMFF